MKAATAVFGIMVGTVIALTILGGGSLTLGTSPQGPYFGFGFKGPQAR